MTARKVGPTCSIRSNLHSEGQREQSGFQVSSPPL